jgi:hypothetical protein
MAAAPWNPVKVTKTVIKEYKVNAAYSAGRGWGGERSFTIQNETLQDEMDRRAYQFIQQDSESLRRIYAYSANLRSNFETYRSRAVETINMHALQGFPIAERVRQLNAQVKAVNDGLKKATAAATAIKKKKYKCALTEALYGTPT